MMLPNLRTYTLHFMNTQDLKFSVRSGGMGVATSYMHRAPDFDSDQGDSLNIES